MTISGKSESVFRAYDQLCTDSTTLGLEIQRDKCEILISKTGEVSEELQNTINQHGLHIQRGATPLLGTVVGTDENEIQKLVVEQMETWKKALELLACEELPTQLSLLIGRWTMTAKPSALTRSLPPNIINKPLADFGEAVLKTMEERLKLRLEGEARQLFRLPLDEGGVGFCPPEETAPYAFLAGVAASCLAFGTTNIKEDVKGWVNKEGWLLSQLQNVLSRYLTEGVDWPEKEGLKNAEEFLKHFGDTNRRKRSEKLQTRLTGEYWADHIPKLKKTLTSETVARMESRSSRATALIWKAYPLTEDFALTNDEMRFTVAYATGQRLPHMPERCGCAHKADLTMEHTVNCSEKLTRHNMIQDRFVAFARQHGVHTKTNPRLLTQTKEQRLQPDVVFYPGTHAPLQTDVTVINPCAPYILKKSTRAHNWATKTRKAEKRLKYLAAAKAKGDDFKPLVFETHGKMAEEIKDLLNMLASNTTMDRGLAVSDMQLDLAVTLARGNALAARDTIGKAEKERDNNAPFTRAW